MRLALAAIACLLAATAVSAQGAPDPNWRPFAAVYDGNAPVLLRGPLTSVDWSGPHVWLHMLDAQTGKPWKVEGGTPEVLMRNGMTAEALAAGTPVVVRGYQAKDKSCTPECLASGRDVTFSDGRKAFMSASGQGAPR